MYYQLARVLGSFIGAAALAHAATHEQFIVAVVALALTIYCVHSALTHQYTQHNPQ